MFSGNSLYLPQLLLGSGQVLKLIACVAYARKAGDEIKSRFLKSFGINKINKLVITHNKLTNNFAGPVTGGLGSNVADADLHVSLHLYDA
jgi:hypothetical protein